MTVIDEKIYLIDSEGQYLAIGRHDQYLVHDADRRDTTNTYAYSSSLDGKNKRDLIAQLTIPWPAQTFYFNQHKIESAGKPNQPVINSEIRENIQRKLQLEITPSFSFPYDICAGTNNCVFIASDNSVALGDGVWGNQKIHRQRIYRLVNCQSGEILLEHKLSGIDEFGGFMSLAAMANTIDVTQQFNQTGVPVAVDSDTKTALFATTQGYQVRVLDENLTLLSRETNPFFADYNKAVWCAGKYVANYDGANKNPGIIVIDPATGQIEKTFDFGSNTISSLSGAMNTSQVICGLCGGAAYLVDIISDKVTKYKPHRGVSGDWPVDARLSASAALIATSAENSLCITSPVLGKTHRLMPIESVVYDSNKPNQSRLVYSPDFCFSDERLVILRGQSVVTHELQEIENIAQYYISDLSHPDYKKIHKYSPRIGLVANIEKSGLARLSSGLAKLWSKPLTIKTTRKVRPLPIGKSRFGGLPDLSDAVKWPSYKGTPLSFIGQINLEQVALQLSDSLLPKQGLLSFFLFDNYYETLDSPDASNATDQKVWQVFYFPCAEQLSCSKQPISTKDDVIITYPQTSLKFVKGGKVMPDVDSLLVTNLQLSENEGEDYLQLLKQLPGQQFEHQILGHPGFIQFDTLELECELLSSGRDPHKCLQKDDPDYYKIQQSAAEWVLLLQLASDNKTDWLWGDAGNLYWMIRRDDLIAENFCRTRVIMQCH